MVKQHFTVSALLSMFLKSVTDRLHHTGMYLIVITRKRNVGSLLGHAVWKAVDFDIISYKKTVLHLSEIQVSRTILSKCAFFNLRIAKN